MIKKFTSLMLLGSAVLMMSSCGDKPTEPAATSTEAPAPGKATLSTDLIVKAKPADAISVSEACKLKPGAEVTFFGKIAGSKAPFVEGMASMMLLDPAEVKTCDMSGDDGCQKPWDACCETDKLPGASLSVQVVDAKGEIIEQSLKGFDKLKELDELVIKGKVSADSTDENTIIIAEKIFVAKRK